MTVAVRKFFAALAVLGFAVSGLPPLPARAESAFVAEETPLFAEGAFFSEFAEDISLDLTARSMSDEDAAEAFSDEEIEEHQETREAETPQAGDETACTEDTTARTVAEYAFSDEFADWHSVVVDLGTNALLRVYARIVSETLPEDVTVEMSGEIASVTTWIGDSSGEETDLAGTDAYLIIEGRAASVDDAWDVSLNAISYTLDGYSATQFSENPVQIGTLRRSVSQDEGGSGCDSGLGLLGLFGGAILWNTRGKGR